jgi:hypothetical protein
MKRMTQLEINQLILDRLLSHEEERTRIRLSTDMRETLEHTLIDRCNLIEEAAEQKTKEKRVEFIRLHTGLSYDEAEDLLN